MTSIRLHEIRKSFGAVDALSGIDLEIEDGENLAVLGPSGSGKSTLLRVIAGLESADSGSVEFAGVSQEGIEPHRRDVAIVFQHFALYPHLTARENITIGLRHGLGMRRAAADARARETAERLRIHDLLDRRPRAMSGGQRQRVALARALARRSGIVLLDEPLSGLDAQLHSILRLEISTLLRDIGATGVNVTHDQLDAMAMADRIAVINKGRIEQLGTPAELYDEPTTAFVAGFIGSPPMNLLPVESDSGRSVFGRHRGLAGGSVLGVRPERMRVTVHDAMRPGSWSVRGTVAMIEPMGQSRVAHVRTVGSTVVAAIVDSRFPLDLGQPITLELDPDDVHVFHHESGARVGRASVLGYGAVEAIDE